MFPVSNLLKSCDLALEMPNYSVHGYVVTLVEKSEQPNHPRLMISKFQDNRCFWNVEVLLEGDVAYQDTKRSGCLPAPEL